LNEKIKTIQIFNQNNEMILECSKGFSFLTRTVNRKQVDDVLMIRGKNIPQIASGEAADVVITTRGGDRIKYFCTVGICTSRQLRVILNIEKAKKLENQRRYYRIKTAINCRIADVTRGESVTPYNPNLYGKIYDINIGGVFIAVETDEKYRENDLISFTTILNSNRLEATAKVLRIQVTDEGEVVGYRCCFIAMSSHQEDMISSYINYLQLEERRIELEIEKMKKDS